MRVEHFSAEELMARAQPVRMKPGDVLFHALSTPHGSPPNRSERLRRTFSIHYLNQEAHDQCGYRPWKKTWWGEAKRAQIARMAADRAALGWSPAFGPHIKEADEGLEFTGAARTPRRLWGDLAEKIPAEKRAEKKTLGRKAATASA